MASLNKVSLIGFLGQDPKIVNFQNGRRAAQLSVATTDRWKDRQTGERRERTEWHRIVIYNESTVGFCERYLKKGMQVFVEGQLQTRKWQDQQGQDRFTAEIVIQGPRGDVQILDRKDSAGHAGGDDDEFGFQGNHGGQGSYGRGQGRGQGYAQPGAGQGYGGQNGYGRGRQGPGPAPFDADEPPF